MLENGNSIATILKQDIISFKLHCPGNNEWDNFNTGS